LAAELALPHRIKRGPFQQAEITPEQLQERIENLAGAANEGEPAEPQENPEAEEDAQKKKS